MGAGSVLGRLGVGVQVLGRLGIKSLDQGNSQARGWGDTSNSILHSRLFGYRGVRGLGSHFWPNTPESLDIGASAQAWLLPAAMKPCGGEESWELVGSHSVKGVTEEAFSLLPTWKPQASVS